MAEMNQFEYTLDDDEEKNMVYLINFLQKQK